MKPRDINAIFTKAASVTPRLAQREARSDKLGKKHRMWRLAFLNLCFALLLTTLLTMQRSAWVTGPDRGYVFVSYDRKPSRSVFEPAWNDRPPDALRISIGFLSDLWRRSIMVREWMLECETTYWETLRAASGAEADLVEARFHLANAEVFASALGEPQKAKIEFERAENYLMVAQPSVEKNALPVLAKIKKEIDAARLDLGSSNSENFERYERLKIDLDHLIATTRSQKLSSDPTDYSEQAPPPSRYPTAFNLYTSNGSRLA
jgi:hypothetical protein